MCQGFQKNFLSANQMSATGIWPSAGLLMRWAAKFWKPTAGKQRWRGARKLSGRKIFIKKKFFFNVFTSVIFSPESVGKKKTAMLKK